MKFTCKGLTLVRSVYTVEIHTHTHTSTAYVAVLFYSLFCLKVKVNPPIDSNSAEQSLLVNFIAAIHFICWLQ